MTASPPSHGVNIRIATEDDVDTLFDIRTSVFENHQSVAELADVGVTASSVAQMLASTSRAWLAELEGEAAGFAMADRTQGTVFGMFVRPRFEGRGVGRRLMREAEGWLFDGGWEEIRLVTGSDPGIRAGGFYRHLGWEAVGLEPDGQTRYVKRRPRPSSER